MSDLFDLPFEEDAPEPEPVPAAADRPYAAPPPLVRDPSSYGGPVRSAEGAKAG